MTVKIQLAYFSDLGLKTILLYPTNASFHSHFNHCCSADPQNSNLNQWLGTAESILVTEEFEFPAKTFFEKNYEY